MRILILYDKPVHNALEAGGVSLTNLAEFLTYLGNKVCVVSLDKKSKTITKNFEEISISYGGSSSKALLISIINNISIELLNKPILYYNEILEKLISLDPELIISHGLASMSVDFVRFLKFYKKTHNNIKLLAITDDVRQIDEHLKAKIDTVLHDKKKIGFLYSVKMKLYSLIVKHIAYSMYDVMVKSFDGLLFFTNDDTDLAVKRYPQYKKKFFVFRRPVKLNVKDVSKYVIRKRLKTTLFVGNCKHLPNVEAMQNIISIANKTKNVNFVITGNGCNKSIKGNVKVVGFVNNINALYLKADAFVAPLKSGSGMKMKLLECFRYGIPIIGTSIAFEGYPVKNGVDCIVEDNIEKYPERISELKDYEKRKRISENSRKIIYYFSYDEAKKTWDKILNSIITKRVNSNAPH